MGSVDVPELVPNVHEKVVPDIGAVVLVKFTNSGGQPDVTDAVNPAVSAAAPLAPASAASKNNNVLKSLITGYFDALPT